MQAIVFYLFYFLVLIFSAMPMRVQYFISDILSLLLQYIARYRRKVVQENLQHAFPEKNKKELRSIERKFYRYLADSFVETYAQINLSKEEQNRRMKYKNIEILDKYYAAGKPVVVALGHYANWELCTNIPLFTKLTVLAIYKKINNPYFDRFYIRLRNHHGIVPVPMEEILRKILECCQQKTLTVTMFLTDQRPLRKNIKYWTTFLNQDTPVYLGIEKIAKKTGAAVLFLKVVPVRRGFYEAEFIPVCEDSSAASPYEITEKHTRILEQIIKEKPEYWLWSHRRWKHKRIIVNENNLQEN